MRNLYMRIGELSRRTGVPAATLRVWERRYGVLQPLRTDGGHRVYTSGDVARVRALQARMSAGRTVALAARELLDRAAGSTVDRTESDPLLAHAWAAVEAFDDGRLRRALAQAVAGLGVPDALDLVVAPVFRRLGDEWRVKARNVAREHFASTVTRAYLLQLLSGSSSGRKPRCLGFCPEGELHDLGLVMAGAALADAGWQPVVLGADTPWVSVEALLDELRPDAVVVGAQRRAPVLRLLDGWSGRVEAPVVLGGAGFRPEDPGRLASASLYVGPYTGLAAAVADDGRRVSSGR